MALTDLKIRKAKQRDKAYKLFDGNGLFLLIRPNGSKLWQQKYRYYGKDKMLSHGPYPDVSLAKARKKRDAARTLLADGGDPATEKRLQKIAEATKARTTLLLVAEEYLERAKERELAPATLAKKSWYLMTLAEPLHQRPIDQITSAEVLHFLKSIERSGRRETAHRVRNTLSGVFKLAILTLRAEHDPTYAIQGALLPVKVVNRAAITDEHQFGDFLRSLEEYTGSGVVKDALLFQILTMTRPGEVRGARKKEFDRTADIWRIPAERMKMRHSHDVPLSRQALAVLERQWHLSDRVELVFPSLNSTRKMLSENAFNAAMRRMGYQKEEVCAHGFRATASTILNARGFDGDVIEVALAHQDKNVIRRTYNRGTYFTQRERLMQDWADLVDGFRSGDATLPCVS